MELESVRTPNNRTEVLILAFQLTSFFGNRYTKYVIDILSASIESGQLLLNVLHNRVVKTFTEHSSD
jgi:hypothetical protein